MGRKDYGEQKSGYSSRGNNGYDKSLDIYLKDISNTYPLSLEEEVELGRRIKTGDIEARNKLVEANLRFVVSVAIKYRDKGGRNLGDLILVGNDGLINAANKFDETKGFKFISYAIWWIRQAILQYLVEQEGIVRLPLNRISTINRFKQFLDDYNQREEEDPNLEDIAKEFNYSITDASLLLTERQHPLYLDAQYDENQRSPYEMIPDSGQEQADDVVDRIALADEFKEVLNSLSEREADVLRYYFGLDGYPEMTLEKIGGKYGLTRERVRQIKEKAIGKLRHPRRGKKLFEYWSGD